MSNLITTVAGLTKLWDAEESEDAVSNGSGLFRDLTGHEPDVHSPREQLPPQLEQFSYRVPSKPCSIYGSVTVNVIVSR